MGLTFCEKIGEQIFSCHLFVWWVLGTDIAYDEVERNEESFSFDYELNMIMAYNGNFVK